jgi:hypothetical protein
MIPAPAAPAAAIPAARPAGPAAPAAPACGPSHRPARFAAILEAQHPARSLAAPAPSPVRLALEGVDRAQRRLDAILGAARAGKTFTAQQLLVVQADAYRLAQTVDLAAKLVEHGAQTVKQAVNAQT